MASNDWIPAKLGDLIEIRHGFAFGGEYFRDDPPGDVLLTPGNFAVGGGFKDDKFKYYVGPVPENFVLGEGDLLVTMTDLSKAADTLGYPALVPSPNDFRFLHNQRLGRVLIRPSSPIRKDFLYYLFHSRPYRNEVLASATGTTVKHTSPERIRAFKFMLPPLDEQRAIAHTLRVLDDKIELNRRMNETLEAMARSIFKSWFVDFDPVRAKAKGLDACLPPDLAQVFPDTFKDSEVGPIPKNWGLRTLYDCATYINGSAFRTEDFCQERSGLPIVKIGELKDGITVQTKFTLRSLAPQYRIRSGDILFSWSGSPDTSIDTFIWTGGDGWLNQHVFKIESHLPEERLFVYYLLRSLKSVFVEIARNKQTTGLGHVTAQDLKRLKTVFPNTETLDAFNRIVEPLFEKVYCSRRESHTLATLRDTLLPKLISGEIRVKDAEKLAEKSL